MINYDNIVSFKKSSLIFIEDQYPKHSFYIITKGKAVSYGNYFDDNIEYSKGHILGLINCVLNEPYFFNVKAEECLFIDDNLNNVNAALELGIKSVHLKKVDDMPVILEDMLK